MEKIESITSIKTNSKKYDNFYLSSSTFKLMKVDKFYWQMKIPLYVTISHCQKELKRIVTMQIVALRFSRYRNK